ncbi:MAG: adenylate/guanylate cyclase domain-containing protein [Alphaproteobacteria bacterium]
MAARIKDRLKAVAAAWRSSPDLPLRVRETIARQQAASEVLIGWIQFGIVATFATLYAVAPKTFSDDAAFEPVPWVLGAYFVFTLIRLALAYRGHLPGWLLNMSVVVDMALLLVTIWSFHLQYGQPASFYLKAPTLLYVFIFIALRALRFEARYVVLAGIVAASGWLVLMLYAIIVDPMDNMVTRDYVLYMTSNHVLVGAEFDKIVSILMVTLILAVAIHRARRLLVRSVAEQTAARELSRFFAPEIAERIAQAEEVIAAGQGEARDAAILFVDIRGFTALAAEIPADDVFCLLSDYQSRMVPAVRAHGGAVDKFMGDGIMATFGAVVPSETYAADALRCVDDLMAEVEAWNNARAATGAPRLRIGAAVATGRVVFGAVGDADRLEYTVIGDAVNLAAKLEKHNKQEGVRALATTETLALAGRQGYVPTAEIETRRGRAVAEVDAPLDLAVLAD